MKPLKVCLLNAGFDTRLTSTAELLDFYQNVPGLAAALAEHGHQVTAIQAYHRDKSSQRGNVAVEFVATNTAGNKNWVEIERFSDIACRLELIQPDIVHFFGLTMLSLRKALGRWCENHGVKLTTSFHGGRPGRNPLSRWRQRRALGQTSAFFFSNTAVAKQWRAAGLIPKKAKITVVPEVSSPFAGMPRQSARESLGVHGSPVFAWSGRLHPDKDPLTMLRGFRRTTRNWPNAQLLMAFSSDEMLNEIEAFLERDATLKQRVTLMGMLDHSDMETLFSAADFFVHSSRREWGSNSLVEALSCGAIPVVSDIPSLRALTEHVEPAILFPVGDAKSLSHQVLKVSINDLEKLSQQVRSAFDEHLSYPVLATRYSAVFERLVGAHAPRSNQ